MRGHARASCHRLCQLPPHASSTPTSLRARTLSQGDRLLACPSAPNSDWLAHPMNMCPVVSPPLQHLRGWLAYPTHNHHPPAGWLLYSPHEQLPDCGKAPLRVVWLAYPTHNPRPLAGWLAS